jgi:hypothetical protein
MDSRNNICKECGYMEEDGDATSLPSSLINGPVKDDKDGYSEGMDHEVSMAKASLQNIVSNASALMNKMGDEEIDIPAWVQDHITNADNYISQANDGYYEYEAGENNEIPDQEIYETKGTSIFGADDKRGDYPVGDLEYRRQKNNQVLAQRKNNYPPPTEKVVLTQKKNARKWKT